ncbi:MAG: leucyl/phenylalanyl-tRNA--protein transferase [Elusimicrobiota bacterium]
MGMRRYAIFPDPRELLDRESVVFVGGDLAVATLVGAYSQGIFPWPIVRGLPIPWHCPHPRGVLDFADFRVPRSLRQFRSRSRGRYGFTFDRAFARVIRSCASVPRPYEDGTWITPKMIEAYIRLHRAGFAHSVECWREDELVGGLYGVYVSGAFSAESMFFLEANASKLCLVELVEALERWGMSWIDIQMVTPVAGLLGAKYIPRDEYLDRLEETHRSGLPEKLVLPGRPRAGGGKRVAGGGT